MAVRWVSDDFPGIVAVELTDSADTVWSIVDKAPVFGDPSLASNATYPRVVLVPCDVVGEPQDDQVQVALRHGVEAADGTARFWVRRVAVYGG